MKEMLLHIFATKYLDPCATESKFLWRLYKDRPDFSDPSQTLKTHISSDWIQPVGKSNIAPAS